MLEAEFTVPSLPIHHDVRRTAPLAHYLVAAPRDRRRDRRARAAGLPGPRVLLRPDRDPAPLLLPGAPPRATTPSCTCCASTWRCGPPTARSSSGAPTTRPRAGSRASSSSNRRWCRSRRFRSTAASAAGSAVLADDLGHLHRRGRQRGGCGRLQPAGHVDGPPAHPVLQQALPARRSGGPPLLPVPVPLQDRLRPADRPLAGGTPGDDTPAAPGARLPPARSWTASRPPCGTAEFTEDLEIFRDLKTQGARVVVRAVARAYASRPT